MKHIIIEFDEKDVHDVYDNEELEQIVDTKRWILKNSLKPYNICSLYKARSGQFPTHRENLENKEVISRIKRLHRGEQRRSHIDLVKDIQLFHQDTHDYTKDFLINAPISPLKKKTVQTARGKLYSQSPLKSKRIPTKTQEQESEDFQEIQFGESKTDRFMSQNSKQMNQLHHMKKIHMKIQSTIKNQKRDFYSVKKQRPQQNQKSKQQNFDTSTQKDEDISPTSPLFAKINLGKYSKSVEKNSQSTAATQQQSQILESISPLRKSNNNKEELENPKQNQQYKVSQGYNIDKRYQNHTKPRSVNPYQGVSTSQVSLPYYNNKPNKKQITNQSMTSFNFHKKTMSNSSLMNTYVEGESPRLKKTTYKPSQTNQTTLEQQQLKKNGVLKLIKSHSTQKTQQNRDIYMNKTQKQFLRQKSQNNTASVNILKEVQSTTDRKIREKLKTKTQMNDSYNNLNTSLSKQNYSTNYNFMTGSKNSQHQQQQQQQQNNYQYQQVTKKAIQTYLKKNTLSNQKSYQKFISSNSNQNIQKFQVNKSQLLNKIYKNNNLQSQQYLKAQ